MAGVAVGVVKALILYSGSSTLKWAVLESPGGAVVDEGSESWSGDAAEQIAEKLQKVGKPDAIGHRLVHGGDAFREAVVVDAAARKTLDGLVALDRLHLGPEIAGIDACAKAFPGVPQVASFDTSFHATMGAAASGYALPYEWEEKWGLRRFGFHGLSVAWTVDRLGAHFGGVPARLVVCHLGSGCSVTAVHDGRSVDTSMGYTSLEGLVMSTRVGNVDAAVVLSLVREHGMAPDEVLKKLTNESGLLGVSGVSGDLRKVLAAADGGNARAKLAYDRFIFSLRRAIGSAVGVLGGADAVVFTGGIGENSDRVRRDGALALGVTLPETKETKEDVVLAESPVKLFVIHAREDAMVLRDIERLLGPRA